MGSATRPHHSDDGQAVHLTVRSRNTSHGSVRILVSQIYVRNERRRPSGYCLTYFVSPPSTAGRDPGPSAPYTFPSASTATPSPAVFQGRS